MKTAQNTIMFGFSQKNGAGVLALLLPLFLSLSGHGADGKDERIFATAWGMTLELDGSGFYNDVVKALLDRSTIKRDYVPLPYKRAKLMFAAEHNSCLYPMKIDPMLRGGEIEDADAYLESAPLIWVESHLFGQPGKPVLQSMEQLRGKLIAYPNGSALPSVLRSYGALYLPTTGELAKARMLLAGRVDFMSGSLPDNVFVFKALKQPLPPYNPDLAIIKVGVGIVCHRTPSNDAFIEAFNAALEQFRVSGKFRALFDGAGVDLRFIPVG